MGLAINSEGQNTGSAFRSCVVVLAGLIAAAVLSVGTDAVLYAMGLCPSSADVPPAPLLLVGTVYRSLYMAVGGYLAARLAPRHPMRHAVAVGVMALALGLLGTVLAWDVAPAWYGLAVTALALPSAWAGGRLFQRRGAGHGA